MDLPKLTESQQKFVIFYNANGNKPNPAYRQSYDCTNMSDKAISVEASRLLKNPKVALWIEYAQQQIQEVFKEEIKYSAKDCFDEIEEVKNLALNSLDKNGNPNVSSVLKAVELKGRLAGHFSEKHKVEGAVTVMNNVTIDGKNFIYEVGDDGTDNSASAAG